MMQTKTAQQQARMIAILSMAAKMGFEIDTSRPLDHLAWDAHCHILEESDTIQEIPVQVVDLEDGRFLWFHTDGGGVGYMDVSRWDVTNETDSKWSIYFDVDSFGQPFELVKYK